MAAIQVTLDQDELFKAFDEHGNENRCEKTQGRSLFPSLVYNVEGFKKEEQYQAELFFRNMETGETTNKIYVTKTGQDLGNHRGELSFAFVKIKCDNTDIGDNEVLVIKKANYIPVMNFYKLSADFRLSLLSTTELNHTKFKVVSGVKKVIQDMKDLHNPLSIARSKAWETRNKKSTEPAAKRQCVQEDSESENDGEGDDEEEMVEERPITPEDYVHDDSLRFGSVSPARFDRDAVKEADAAVESQRKDAEIERLTKVLIQRDRRIEELESCKKENKDLKKQMKKDRDTIADKDKQIKELKKEKTELKSRLSETEDTKSRYYRTMMSLERMLRDEKQGREKDTDDFEKELKEAHERCERLGYVYHSFKKTDSNTSNKRL